MPMDARALSLALWVLLCVIWLVAMPKKTRGKAWHYVMMAVPLLVLAARLLGLPPILAESITNWLTCGLVIAVITALAWVAGTMKRNHGIMDVAYSLAPAVAGWMIYAIHRPANGLLSLGFLATLTLWSVRLSVQTWGHNIRSERQPYAHWRKTFGKDWLWWSAFQVHLLQGVTIWIWCAPFAFILTAPAPHALWIAAAGLLVWLSGFGLQSTADRQLAAFKADPANRGGLLDTGVWAFVRHPNYLGESLMWAGWFVMALSHPFGWLSLIGPAYNTYFMGFASAAPFKEGHMARTRPAAWAAYCARTPRFFPFPRPRSSKVTETRA